MMSDSIAIPSDAKHVSGSADAEATGAIASPPLIDVWSRSGSKYRVRAVVLLAINVLLFAGAGAFAYWLRSGELFAPAKDGYRSLLWQTLRGVGQGEVSLGSLLIGPISVQEAPMLIPILGLLMAALVSIPILVAILYRFWSSLPFVAVVGFLAVMPWLAITLLGSCVLSSVRPFRTRFRFVSALLGLVPVIVYLALAWNGTREVIVGRIDPVDAIKFVAPWVLAIVASAAVFAIVLALARLVNYRPGAVTPLLAVMFALPVALFEQYVGRDELYYRLLEKLDAAHFAEVDASVDLARAAKRAWERHPLPRPAYKVVHEQAEQKWLFELASDLGPVQTELARHQTEIADRCDWFLRYFPDSRYAPNALYIKARAKDRRVDLLEFRRTKWIRFYEDFPNQASEKAWRMILENRPDTPAGTVATLRLSQLDARDGDIHRAVKRLGELLSRLDRQESRLATALAASSRKPASTRFGGLALHIPLDRVVLEARRLHALLASNNDPLYGYEPMAGPRRKDDPIWFGLLDLDPRSDYYVEQLSRLKARYPNCQIEDNIDLEIARTAVAAADRIALYQSLLDRFPDRDSAAEAILRLGFELEMEGHREGSLTAFARLERQFPHSFWCAVAAQTSRLGGLVGAARSMP